MSNPQPAPIWWTNSIFFVGMHLAGLAGALWVRPWKFVPNATKLLCVVSWELSSIGISLGYHRLWSHRSFTARKSLRIALAMMGSLGFQGSIQWWCLRHRLHHRYTDDPVHDPYCATRGLFFSHMGWIFTRPKYERMSLVDKSDLERDEVVRFQHRYYVPLALFLGLVLPGLVASLWHDALGGFIWGGIVTRLIGWHCTFSVNSLAHWNGLQPYTDEITARGSLVLALLTSGEGNHNFHVSVLVGVARSLSALISLRPWVVQHAFPQDYRAGPNPFDWDPCKWVITLLHRHTGLIPTVRCAKNEEVREAEAYMRERRSASATPLDPPHDGRAALRSDAMDTALDVWDAARLHAYVRAKGDAAVVIVVDGWVVDATRYAPEHPGGALLLRKYAVRAPNDDDDDDDDGGGGGERRGFGGEGSADWAFHAMNDHSRNARRRLDGMRVARLRFASQ